MANYKAQYTNVAQVQLYLRRKADYGLAQDTILDAITPQQIKAFIVNAEARVETDMSRQYIIPFQNTNGGAFNTLPQNTQVRIQEMCTWMAVWLVLSIYYGSSEGDRGEAFAKACETQYKILFTQATGKDSHGQYKYTPLLELALNPNAAYRSDAGAQAPLTAVVGACAFDDANITKRKLTNLNKSLLYGWIAPVPGRFNR